MKNTSCPVCSHILRADGICPQCGYDRSCDYEQNPTFSPLPATLSRSGFRARWEQAQKKRQKQTLHTVVEGTAPLREKLSQDRIEAERQFEAQAQELERLQRKVRDQAELIETLNAQISQLVSEKQAREKADKMHSAPSAKLPSVVGLPKYHSALPQLQGQSVTGRRSTPNPFLHTNEADSAEDTGSGKGNQLASVEDCRRLAEQGDADAQYQLANYFYDGNGVEKDKTAAVLWYRKAAEQGHAKAQYYLGYSYAYGRGVPEDKAEAVRWYQKAAQQGYARAQYRLGVCYEFGTGVAMDSAKAAALYRSAAEQNDADAQYCLSRCYRTGSGLKKDKTQADDWLNQAGKNGSVEAKTELRKAMR